MSDLSVEGGNRRRCRPPATRGEKARRGGRKGPRRGLDLSRLKRPWYGGTDAAATFVLTLLRLGWSAQSARHLTTHDGTTLDVLAVAPKTVGFWVDHL